MLKEISNHAILNPAIGTAKSIIELRLQDALLKTGVLQNALKSANFSSVVTDEKGVIQICNVGAERMLGDEVIACAKALRAELEAIISPGFETFDASRGIEDIYRLGCTRKDGSRFPAIVSVTTLRDAQSVIVGYMLIGTYSSVRKQAEKMPLKTEAGKSATSQRRQFVGRGLMADLTNPTAISPKVAASYGCSRLTRSHGQCRRCRTSEKLINTNETGQTR